MSSSFTSTIPSRRGAACRILCLLLVPLQVFWLGGCAAIIRGNHQTVTVFTQPQGSSVEYEGRVIADGETFTMQNTFDEPYFVVRRDGWTSKEELQYKVDPLVIVDAALLIVFILPGLVALGVDFGTGAWRDLDDSQIVHVPGDRQADPQPAVADESERVP